MENVKQKSPQPETNAEPKLQQKASAEMLDDLFSRYRGLSGEEANASRFSRSVLKIMVTEYLDSCCKSEEEKAGKLSKLASALDYGGPAALAIYGEVLIGACNSFFRSDTYECHKQNANPTAEDKAYYRKKLVEAFDPFFSDRLLSREMVDFVKTLAARPGPVYESYKTPEGDMMPPPLTYPSDVPYLKGIKYLFVATGSGRLDEWASKEMRDFMLKLNGEALAVFLENINYPDTGPFLADKRVWDADFLNFLASSPPKVWQHYGTPLRLYFDSLGALKSADIPTREGVKAFAREIGAELAGVYFKPMKGKGVDAEKMASPELLASAEFIKSLDARVAAAYLAAFASTDKTDVLLGEKFKGFITSLTQENAVWYLSGLDPEATTKKDPGVLLDERVFTTAGFLNLFDDPKMVSIYFHAMSGMDAAAVMTGKEFIDFATALGPFRDGFLIALSKTAARSEPARAGTENTKPEPAHLGTKPALAHLLKLWEKSPDAMKNVIDRIPELAFYGSILSKFDYDASEEVEFLVKKGNKAQITKLAVSLDRSVTSIHKDVLGYICSLKGKGFKPDERIAAIDALAAFTRMEYSGGFSPVRMREAKSALSAVLGPKKRIWDDDVKEKYPDVFEYLDRHYKYAEAHPEYKSPIFTEMGDTTELDYLLAECFAANKELNLNTVNTEKQQLGRKDLNAPGTQQAARKREVVIKPKYEEKFMSELRTAAERARYGSLMDALDVHRRMLEKICGQKLEKREIPDQMKNVLEGIYGLRNNEQILVDFVKIYWAQGPEAAQKWVRGLEGNVRVEARMRERGTDIEALDSFEVAYDAVKPKEMVVKQQVREAQVYSQIISLMQDLGFKKLEDLEVAGTEDKAATAEAIAKKLNQLVRENKLSMEEKVIVDEINGHVEDLKSAVGQLHAVSEGRKTAFFISDDPLEALNLGVGFPSCLDISKGVNRFGAVARAIDRNNRTLYVAEGGRGGQIIGRVSLIECDQGFFVNSHFYENTNYDLFNPEQGWVTALVELGKATGRDVMIVPALFSPHESMKQALEKAGFVPVSEVAAHIDKAACDAVYSDLGFKGYVPKDGIDCKFEAYVLKAKK